MNNNSKFSFEETTNITIDPSMKVSTNPAPTKMAYAVELIEKYVLPNKKKRPKKQKKIPVSLQREFTTLQNELLNFYTFEPNTEQLEKLKNFMLQLFSEEVQREEAKQREHLDKSVKEKIAA